MRVQGQHTFQQQWCRSHDVSFCMAVWLSQVTISMKERLGCPVLNSPLPNITVEGQELSMSPVQATLVAFGHFLHLLNTQTLTCFFSWPVSLPALDPSSSSPPQSSQPNSYQDLSNPPQRSHWTLRIDRAPDGWKGGRGTFGQCFPPSDSGRRPAKPWVLESRSRRRRGLPQPRYTHQVRLLHHTRQVD